MQGRARRQYPRIDCDHRGELHITRRSDAGSAAPVTVRSLSLGGLGLAFDEWEGAEVQRGARVLVRVPLGGTMMELPGRVAWVMPRPWQRFDLGVRLELQRSRDHGSAYAAYVSSMWAG